MKKVKKQLTVVVFVITVLSLLAGGAVLAAARVSLTPSKVTVRVGKTKTIRVKKAGKKISWNILSGKKNISITKGKNSVKITGKREGKAKVQAKVGNRKLTCQVTVTGNSNTDTAGGTNITVSSGSRTIVYRLNDSQAAKDLYNQLPLTLDVENYSNNEKIFYPPRELKTSDTPKSDGRKGSLAYYAPWGDVVMFYDSASSASGLYELGTVVSGQDDISELSGRITISKAEK